MSIILYSLIILFIPPALFFSLYFIRKDFIHWRRYLWMFVLAVGLLAFSYVANSNGGGDLLRYIERMRIYSRYSLFDVLKLYYWEETGATIWMWLVSKTGLEGLLTGVPTAIVYSVAGYITCDFAERTNEQKRISVLLLLQILLLPFISIVNNIFCVCSFALIIFASYRDLVQGKRNWVTLLLYVMPCFIHIAGISILIVRLLAVLLKSKVTKILPFILVFTFSAIINVAYRHISLFSSVPLLYDAINRVWFYLYLDDSEFSRQVSLSLWYHVLYLGNMLYAISVIFAYLRLSFNSSGNADYKATKLENKESVFKNLIYILAVICVGCSLFSLPHYWRFSCVTILTQSVIVIRNETIDGKYRRLPTMLIWLSGAIITLLYVYKIPEYIDLKETVYNFLCSSPYVILFKLLKNFISN